MKTNTTKDEVNKMDDETFLKHIRKFPFASNWEDVQAYFHANNRFCRMQGEKYNQTGNINSFKRFY